MKTLFNSTSDYAMEMVRRTMYSLQVLVIVLAVPVFFVTGITARSHKKNTPSQNTTEVSTGGQLSAKPMATYTIVKI